MAHLVEEAAQAQVVLLTENRNDVHRGAQAGPDFGSVVYGTIEEALAFIPPAEAPPAYGSPAYAAASGHAASASGVPCCCLACASVFRLCVVSKFEVTA